MKQEKWNNLNIVILIVFILFFAFFLRFYKLGSNSPSLTWDEAAWGYNAYALGIDGRDEFGRFLPLDYLESFGDFKPPVYAYLDILPVKIFGLNEFATRFPSAFFGSLTVLVTYFLVKQIFKTAEKKEWYATASAFVLAFSPWHIMLSRAAFEANIATFFIATGVWLFLKALQEKPWILVLSIISFVLSLYTFNSARVVTPLLLVILAMFYRKKLLFYNKQTMIAVIIGVLMMLPITKFLMSPQASLRFKEVNIFSDPEVVKISNQEIANDHNSTISKIIHNRRWLYTISYFRHYFDNLNPQFLFIRGDGNPKFSTQDVGELYLWDIVFFVTGIFLLFQKKEGNWFLIPLWLLLGIIPAATARETPHALRIEATLPTFQIFVGYGIVNLSSKLNYRRILLTTIFLLFLFNIFYFLHGYYTHYAKEYSGEWQYGYKESIAYVQSQRDKYDQIYVTDALGRPYVYYAFFTKTNPKTFRQSAVVKRDVFGFVHVEGFEKYRFIKTTLSKKNRNILYIDIPGNVPGNAKVLKTFNLLNGDPVLVAYAI